MEKRKVILVEKKSVYGRELIYPVTFKKELEILTGKQTIDETDIKALQGMGFLVLLKSVEVLDLMPSLRKEMEVKASGYMPREEMIQILLENASLILYNSPTGWTKEEREEKLAREKSRLEAKSDFELKNMVLINCF